MDKCLFCGRPANAAHFMVKGSDGKSSLCNSCISMVSIIANQAYLEMDEHEEPFSNVRSVTEEEIEAFEEASEDWDELAEEELPFDLEPIEEVAPKKLLPKDIMAVLNKHVIGQDKAKKTLAVAVYNHAKRLKDTTGRIHKSNILMVGPSGTGKTLLAQTLANVLDVPFAIADATSLTEAGYVGDDVENILVRLLLAADGDIKKVERGIVYIDEIDKIAYGNT